MPTFENPEHASFCVTVYQLLDSIVNLYIQTLASSNQIQAAVPKYKNSPFVVAYSSC